jgi:hypothetical protein
MAASMNPPAASNSSPVSLYDWTGYYTITLVVVQTTQAATAAALPKGLRLNPSYGAGGKYPILLSIGNIEDARPRVGGSLGFNYYEVFSAIPGVEVDATLDGVVAPYVFPYRGYLNRLLPVVMGRVSGFRKYWERVNVQQFPDDPDGSPNSETFEVKSLLSGKPLLDGKYSFLGELGLAGPNSRIRQMERLLPPNIIGVDPSGKLRRNIFNFRFDRGLAWDLDQAIINIRVAGVIPGVNQPVTIEYPPRSATAIVWQEDNRYMPVRAFVPWRLQAGGEVKTARQTQAVAAASGSTAPPSAASKPGA